MPTSKMTVVSWYDRDIGQISSILTEKVTKRYQSCKVMYNKYSTKETGT